MRTNILLLLNVVLSLCCSARTPYGEYKRLTIKELYDKACDYQSRQMPDSALVCFVICAEKYDADLSREELEMTVNSMRREAQIYFYNFYEYGVGCDRLAKAAQLCNYHNLNKIYPQILIEEAGAYMTYANQNPDKKLIAKAEQLYKEAIREAYRIGDKNVMASAYVNLATHYQATGKLNDLKEETGMFGEILGNDTSGKYEYSKRLYSGLRELMAENPADARRIFLEDGFENLLPRHRFKLIVAVVRTYIQQNQLDSAIIYEQRLLDLCNSSNLIDGRSIVLRDLGNLYKAIGDTVTGEKYAMLGLQYKDSLININHLDNAANLSFLKEMYSLHEEMEGEKRRARALTIFVIVLIIAIALSAYIFIRKYRRSKKAVANATAALDAIQREIETGGRSFDNAADDESATGPQVSADGESHAGMTSNSIDDFTYSVLKKRIQLIFTQDNPVIYTPGFSIEDVAKTIRSNSRYVSKIINETYGCNFSTLLSTLRVREAAARIADTEHYGNMTFEAIALSVGFGTRASFNSAFKRLYGKTPREYKNAL